MNIELEPSLRLRILCWIGVAAMVAQLLFLAEPAFAVRVVQLTWDKLIHFSFFGVIAFLLWIATDKKWPLAVWATVLFIGALDETQQAYTPGRTSDINDWLADGFGAATALMLMTRVSPPTMVAARGRNKLQPGD